MIMQLKARKLPNMKGSSSPTSEGGKEDDWLLVDCQNCLVHLMMPGKVAYMHCRVEWAIFHNHLCDSKNTVILVM